MSDRTQDELLDSIEERIADLVEAVERLERTSRLLHPNEWDAIDAAEAAPQPRKGDG